MSTFVLIHGAFRGAWAWDRVRDALGALGHTVIARDLPGAGARYEAGMEPVTLTECIDDVATWVAHAQVVLAGHSQGGFIARAASERLAERIAVLAYLDAPVPRHGEAARDLMPGGRVDVELDPRAWIDPPGDDPRLTPVPVAMSIEPVTLTDQRALALPERFAFCARTPPAFPCWHTRARLDADQTPYDVLDTDHDAPMTAPGLVANWLDRVAREARA